MGTKRPRTDTDCLGEHKRLCDRLHEAQENKSLTDVEFLVGEEKTPFAAHKLILSLGSPVFQTMFSGRFPQEGSISIPDICPSGFRCLLRFLYKDQVLFTDAKEAISACDAADKYMIPDMKTECEEYLCQNLTPANVFDVMHFAKYRELEPLSTTCTTYISRHACDILKTDGITSALRCELENILKSDIPGSEALDALVEWGEHQTEDEEKFNEVVGPLLRHITFSQVSLEKFWAVFTRHRDLMSEFNSLAIVKHLMDSNRQSLPSWCRNSRAVIACDPPLFWSNTPIYKIVVLSTYEFQPSFTGMVHCVELCFNCADAKLRGFGVYISCGGVEYLWQEEGHAKASLSCMAGSFKKFAIRKTYPLNASVAGCESLSVRIVLRRWTNVFPMRESSLRRGDFTLSTRCAPIISDLVLV